MEESYNREDCVVDRHRHKFSCPNDLLDDFISNNVVLFAGSGISTESKNVLYYTFYEYILGELGVFDNQISFPDLMEEYCKQPNGRINLISQIKNRFKYIRSFPSLFRNATKFHISLNTLFLVNTIVTTNWDTYFEEICSATPFVSDQDLAFWNIDERRVLKIHGSINNYGSIIATSSDYEKCSMRLNEGLIGSILKTLLATNTIVFAGYSFSDNDFVSIYEFVSDQMKGFQRQAYIINPFKDECEKFEEIGLIPIITDAEYFLSQIKQQLVSKNIMLPDKIYDEAQFLMKYVEHEHLQLHDEFSCFDHPQIIFTASYQDGMIHALEHICSSNNCNDYSNPKRFRGIFKPYLEWQKQKLKQKLYEDVAYIEGYLRALAFVLMDENDKKKYGFPPFYFAFGVKEEIKTLENYNDVIDSLPELHKSSYKRAKTAVNKLKSSGGISFHHPAWL